MKRASRQKSWTFRAAVFGLMPCALGLGAGQYLRWTDSVWLSTAGAFWPIVLAAISVAMLVKLWLSPFEELTSSFAAWAWLALTWLYVPLWATGLEVPNSAAIVSHDRTVHLASETSRFRDARIWLLAARPGYRIVRNVAGRMTASDLDLEYRFAEPYIATRGDGEDLAAGLARTARQLIEAEAGRPRSARIALLEDRASQNAVLDKICSAATGHETPCPLRLRLTPHSDATTLGATWSRYYSEAEAIAERHLETLVRLLTEAGSPPAEADTIFRLILESAATVEPLALLAQKPHFLDDRQFDTLIGRILASPGCGNAAITILAGGKRLAPEQRRALRDRALGEARVAALVEHAQRLHLADAELAALAPRLGAAFPGDPSTAMRALEVLGERLPVETRRAAVDAIVTSSAQHALGALRHVLAPAELRQALATKVLADAGPDDFKALRLTREALQALLTPAEMRALIAIAVQRSESSAAWLEFALASLPIHAMTPAERKSLVTGMLFAGPKAAVEFVSENRRFLDTTDVDEVTRDYTRTITKDFCLHLSHRNANRRMAYFSERQLQIFRTCAGVE